VVAVSSKKKGVGGRNPAAQYKLFDIGGEPGAWELHLSRHGLTGPAMPPAQLMSLDLTLHSVRASQAAR